MKLIYFYCKKTTLTKHFLTANLEKYFLISQWSESDKSDILVELNVTIDNNLFQKAVKEKV